MKTLQQEHLIILSVGIAFIGIKKATVGQSVAALNFLK